MIRKKPRAILPLMTIALLAAAMLGGCQPRVSKVLPVPLPLHSAPAQSVVVVGVGPTEEEARQRAMHRLVHEILLPGSREDKLPFIESMIRGYNVVSTDKSLFGQHYGVTIELTMPQLAQNYQELHGQCELQGEQIAELRERAEAAEGRLQELQQRLRSPE